MWEELDEEGRRRWQGNNAAAGIHGEIVPLLREQGFVRLQLLDAPERFPIPTLVRLLVGLSDQMGFLLPQTHRNNHTALIRDAGRDYHSVTTRGHETNAELPFHSDRADLNALLYVRSPGMGGSVSVLPYHTAVQAIECSRPDLLLRLLEPIPYDLRDERIFPQPLWHLRPILWECGGQWRGHYIRRFITDSQRHPNCPRLSDRQVETLDQFDAALASLRPSCTFLPRPGELLIMNNFRIMHARSKFTDLPTGEGRLALRTWVAPSFSERLPEFLLPTVGALVAGSYRGGVGQGDRYLHRLGQTRT
jgi:hypothetical protein